MKLHKILNLICALALAGRSGWQGGLIRDAVCTLDRGGFDNMQSGMVKQPGSGTALRHTPVFTSGVVRVFAGSPYSNILPREISCLFLLSAMPKLPSPVPTVRTNCTSFARVMKFLCVAPGVGQNFPCRTISGRLMTPWKIFWKMFTVTVFEVVEGRFQVFSKDF